MLLGKKHIILRLQFGVQSPVSLLEKTSLLLKIPTFRHVMVLLVILYDLHFESHVYDFKIL